MEVLNGMPVFSGERDFGFKIGVDGSDLICESAFCKSREEASWFGGPADSEDDGDTASGVADHVYGVMGCSLPMCGRGAATEGSPIPFLPWRHADGLRLMVRVYCHATCKEITVPLIDVGPSFGTDHAIDLTEAAFNALGLTLGQGLASVDFRILGGAQYLGSVTKSLLAAFCATNRVQLPEPRL